MQEAAPLGLIRVVVSGFIFCTRELIVQPSANPAISMIGFQEFRKMSIQVPLVGYDHVVQAASTNRTDHRSTYATATAVAAPTELVGAHCLHQVHEVHAEDPVGSPAAGRAARGPTETLRASAARSTPLLDAKSRRNSRHADTHAPAPEICTGSETGSSAW